MILIIRSNFLLLDSAGDSPAWRDEISVERVVE